jgi:tetratricopeptide (TPR) repeat protein
VRKGQWVLAIGAVVLAITLYFGAKTSLSKKTETTSVARDISWEDIEQKAVASLSPAALDSLAMINKAYQSEDTSQKTKFLADLVLFWFHHNQKHIAAYKIYQHAQSVKSPDAYTDAGDAFTDAFKCNTDSTISNKIITFALQSYEKVLELVPGDVNTRIKMAEIYVQGTGEPMKGIGILKSIVDSLPDNVPALIALGRLSMQSGQYDKAKERLEKVLKLEPQNTEAMYFLAIAEAESGNSEKAIQLLEMCKKIVANPEFDKEIDTFIKDLKNKKV